MAWARLPVYRERVKARFGEELFIWGRFRKHNATTMVAMATQRDVPRYGLGTISGLSRPRKRFPFTMHIFHVPKTTNCFWRSIAPFYSIFLITTALDDILVSGSMGQWWRITSRFDVALRFLFQTGHEETAVIHDKLPPAHPPGWPPLTWAGVSSPSLPSSWRMMGASWDSSPNNSATSFIVLQQQTKRAWAAGANMWPPFSTSSGPRPAPSSCCWSKQRDAGEFVSKLERFPNQISMIPTLSLPRVIKFKFLLQPHQKNYITQCEELSFS